MEFDVPAAFCKRHLAVLYAMLHGPESRIADDAESVVRLSFAAGDNSGIGAADFARMMFFLEQHGYALDAAEYRWPRDQQVAERLRSAMMYYGFDARFLDAVATQIDVERTAVTYANMAAVLLARNRGMASPLFNHARAAADPEERVCSLLVQARGTKSARIIARLLTTTFNGQTEDEVVGPVCAVLPKQTNE